MKRNVAAGEKPARRITVAHVEREEVVRARFAVVRYIDSEADLLLADLARAGEMRLIPVEAQTADLHRAE